jgi:hypothetical protein
MARHTRYMAAHRELALVAEDRIHRRGLADQANAGPIRALREFGEHGSHTDAANLFVVREGKMDRGLQRLRQELRNRRKHAGYVPLHVSRSAAVQPAVPMRQLEWGHRPRLPFNRNHVGVPRKHDPAAVPRTQGRE